MQDAESFWQRVMDLRDLIAHGHEIALVNPAWQEGGDGYRCDELYGMSVLVTRLSESLPKSTAS